MNVLTVALLGLGAGAAFGILALAVALTQAPAAKARRAALAGAMGGAVAFTLTALVQLPFFANGDIAVPLATSGLAGAVGAGLAAMMILRARPQA